MRSHIRPRKPIDYNNEDQVRVRRRTKEDRLDSHTIIGKNKHVLIPAAKHGWHNSPAAADLAALPKSGLWVPNWVPPTAKHPARARLLSWLLCCFGDCKETDSDGQPICRAQARDENGQTWWQTTRRRIAEETMLDIHVADRARKALVRMGLIEVKENDSGLIVRPAGRALIEAYFNITRDPEVEDELKHKSEKQQWLGSHTRKAAEKNAKGTFIHDALMILCDHQPGPAMVLAQVLFWFGLDSEGRSRVRITRRGKLWIAKSLRQFRAELGGDANAIAGYVRWLTERGYLESEPNRWCYMKDRDHGRPTLHVRPRPKAIEKELKRRKKEIQKAIELKNNFKTKSKE